MATSDDEARAVLQLLMADMDFCEHVLDGVRESAAVDAVREVLDTHARAQALISALRGDARREASAHKMTETNRCLRIIDEVIASAEARRPGHHAVPWLQAVRKAIADDVNPKAEAAEADLDKAIELGNADAVEMMRREAEEA